MRTVERFTCGLHIARYWGKDLHNGLRYRCVLTANRTLCHSVEGLKTFWHSTRNGCHYPVTQQQYFMFDHIKSDREAENECLVEGEATVDAAMVVPVLQSGLNVAPVSPKVVAL